jgi:hypothetical protein
MFDIIVRWRQVSEPGDPVWWIDRFPTEAFEDGFGLQTPIGTAHPDRFFLLCVTAVSLFSRSERTAEDDSILFELPSDLSISEESSENRLLHSQR